MENILTALYLMMGVIMGVMLAMIFISSFYDYDLKFVINEYKRYFSVRR